MRWKVVLPPLPPRFVVVLFGVLVVRDAVLNVVPRSCPRFCEHRVLSTNEVLPYAHQSEFDLQDTCLELPSERLSSPKKKQQLQHCKLHARTMRSEAILAPRNTLKTMECCK